MIGNWSLLWMESPPLWGHGFHPTKDSGLQPIYEWWKLGPIEVRYYIPRTVDMRYVDVLDFTRSNNKKTCLECGIPITEENDSGWERFTTDGRTTQSVCKTCDALEASQMSSNKAGE